MYDQGFKIDRDTGNIIAVLKSTMTDLKTELVPEDSQSGWGEF